MKGPYMDSPIKCTQRVEEHAVGTQFSWYFWCDVKATSFAFRTFPSLCPRQKRVSARLH